MGSQVLQPLGSNLEPPPGLCDDDAAPESWELVDLEESVKNLLASSTPAQDPGPEIPSSSVAPWIPPALSCDDGEDTDDVDSFLREALQNRDRLTILRLEQEVDKFMRNPTVQQLEFQPMPSSYLRLVAHRVAQHYNLQSSVVDSNTPDGTRIIARKTPDSRFPRVRLSDIQVDKPLEGKLVHVAPHKVEIKRRPSKGLKFGRDSMGSGDSTSRLNAMKSVEERKDDYNKARARIFSSNDLAGRIMAEEAVESSQNVEGFFDGTSRLEEKVEEAYKTVTRLDSNDGLARTLNVKAERDSSVRYKVNSNRVAIFRDREKDRKDPDYNRNYDRYTQRFDPGFGVNVGPFGVQALYMPTTNYNTEFPQLGGPARTQICVDPLPPQSSQPLQGPWAGSSNSLHYGNPDLPMRPFNPVHLGQHSGSGLYMHLPQFNSAAPTMTYVHPQEHFQQFVPQPKLQSEENLNQARRR